MPMLEKWGVALDYYSAPFTGGTLLENERTHCVEVFKTEQEALRVSMEIMLAGMCVAYPVQLKITSK